MRIVATLPLFVLLSGCVLLAQDPPGPPPPPPGSAVAYAGPGASFDAQQLEQLLAPVALYPDPLLALMLPASTAFADLTQAAQFLATGGSVNEVDLQPWDDSVRALAHYPQIVRWMADNPAWTQQLGDAFVAQPDNVMGAIQRLRARARAAGTLVDTPQQRVIVDGDTISIEPADPGVIYVPYYDPLVVYEPPSTYFPGDYFSYSPAFVTGWWLSFGMDWHRHHVWQVERGQRERYWREHRGDWHRPHSPQHGETREVHRWRPRNAPPHWGNAHRSQPAPGARDHRQDHPVNGGPGSGDHRGNWHTRRTNAPHSPDTNPAGTVSPRATGRGHWTGSRPATTPAATPATSAPSVTTPPPAMAPRASNPWHHSRGRGTVFNPRAPQPTRPASPPVSPAPSASLPGYTNRPRTMPAPAPAMHTLPSAPVRSPNPGYRSPTPSGGWHHSGPAGNGAPIHHATPPPSAPAQQPASAPPSDGNGRPGHGRDRQR